MHNSGFELEYQYWLEASRNSKTFELDFKLAPGTIVGNIIFKMNIDKAFKSRSNLPQGKHSESSSLMLASSTKNA